MPVLALVLALVLLVHATPCLAQARDPASPAPSHAAPVPAGTQGQEGVGAHTASMRLVDAVNVVGLAMGLGLALLTPEEALTPIGTALGGLGSDESGHGHGHGHGN